MHRFRPSLQQQQPASLQLSSGLGSLGLQPQSASQPSSFLDMEDDDFGDFAMPSTTATLAPVQSSTTATLAPLQSSFVSLSPSPGLSLAQAPVKTAAATPKIFSSTFPIDEPLQHFGGRNTFPIDQPVPVSASKTFDIDKPIPAVTPPLPHAPMKAQSLFLDAPAPAAAPPPAAVAGPVMPLPPAAAAPMAAAPAAGGDKYSALRDLLASPPPALETSPPAPPPQADQADFDDFGDFVESVPSVPSMPSVAAPAPAPAFPFLGSIYSSPAPAPVAAPPRDEWSLSPPPLASTQHTLPPVATLTPRPPAAAAEVEDVFDEWSLPPSHEAPELVTSVQPPPPRGPAPTLPFLSSSPPPPALAAASSPPPLDAEDFSLPSEQFGFSDQEIFGIKQQPKPGPVLGKPQSLQEVIEASKSSSGKTSESRLKISPEPRIEEPLPTLDEAAGARARSPVLSSPDPGPAPVKSPECQSVASLELEASTATAEATEPAVSEEQIQNPEPSPVYAEWLLILSEIRKLFETVRNTFDNIIYEDLKEELITHDQGRAYLHNFAAVHSVFQRIQHSYRRRVAAETVSPLPAECGNIDQILTEVDTSWRRMLEHCQDYASPLSAKTAAPPPGGGCGEVCGVCLCGGAELEVGGRFYHAQCANYWVNCVADTALPRLSWD